MTRHNLHCILACGDAAPPSSMVSPHPTSDSPESVVQRQLDAYNGRDIDALVATYSADAKIYEHPSTLVACGAAQIRERLSARLTEPKLHARLLHRIVMGQFVIDHEVVTRTFPEGPGTLELVATYDVANGRIQNAWFLAGAKILN